MSHPIYEARSSSLRSSQTGLRGISKEQITADETQMEEQLIDLQPLPTKLGAATTLRSQCLPGSLDVVPACRVDLIWVTPNNAPIPRVWADVH